MPDLTTIGVALSSLKTSMDIAKALKNSTVSLSEAEQKLKVAELISSLADLKTELADVKINLIDKDDEIKKLKEELKDKDIRIFDGDVYWKEVNGNKEGPYCPTCLDVEKLSVRLHKEGPGWWCKKCKDHFGDKDVLHFNFSDFKRNKF
ncbi:conserved hypothetical protein [Arcobacter nitrofigilis DSM 7299]|uniref:Uncharacterized protein n=1 Tax=Arcobacter nitrofigilis (strain ATCC 33309 / DSM 7299 / CCUG 15893 / LMG 7604 / NCTC 12251 / CI) TaxID=572480 RepID=D5V2H5_ARCNC|nr:hypothetical protein [Arcobacter nitrofigilis]ADG92408.1 conserved hypothetical protein [Arcobacter nitrofigilis DSM 7299]